jgi:hypothetical protein
MPYPNIRKFHMGIKPTPYQLPSVDNVAEETNEYVCWKESINNMDMCDITYAIRFGMLCHAEILQHMSIYILSSSGDLDNSYTRQRTSHTMSIPVRQNWSTMGTKVHFQKLSK